MNTTTAPQTITAQQLATIAGQFLTLSAVYAVQKTARALRHTLSAWRALRSWLITPRDYFATEAGEPCEPITATGWQLLGMCAACLVFCLVCTIQW